MRFIKTIDNTIINFDEIYKISYEWDKSNTRLHSYFFLKNGEKLDAFETADSFNLEDSKKEYQFCCLCHCIMNQVLLKNIHEFYSKDKDNIIFDINKYDDSLLNDFLEWAENNIDQLVKN